MWTWVEPGEPAVVGDVGDLGEPDRRDVGLAVLDQRLECERLRLEGAHNGDFGGPDREFHAERTRVMEDPVAARLTRGVGVGGRVELAVGGGEVDAAGDGVVVGVNRGQRQRAHGPGPVPFGDVDPAERPAVGLEQIELREPAAVGDERDPLRIGGPARVEGVVLEEKSLVGLAADRGLHVQVLELVAEPAVEE